ncbi:MAG TPA: hypothetical protein DCY79_01520 [Planctomycetaceae bacterium]|nr:hypothetical protein [Blastopirellula sp.]HAY78465.1 hypothetical protein [Planctomycetaceae bacterium]
MSETPPGWGARNLREYHTIPKQVPMFGKLPDVYYDHDPILTTLLMLVGLMGQSGLCVQKIPSKSPKQAPSTRKKPP